jgi:hypothetical protein
MRKNLSSTSQYLFCLGYFWFFALSWHYLSCQTHPINPQVLDPRPLQDAGFIASERNRRGQSSYTCDIDSEILHTKYFTTTANSTCSEQFLDLIIDQAVHQVGFLDEFSASWSAPNSNPRPLRPCVIQQSELFAENNSHVHRFISYKNDPLVANYGFDLFYSRRQHDQEGSGLLERTR